MSLLFEWDRTKASANLKKHKISFNDKIRIIGARKATRAERSQYER